jgi:hypothetical protein
MRAGVKRLFGEMSQQLPSADTKELYSRRPALANMRLRPVQFFPSKSRGAQVASASMSFEILQP